MTAMRAPKFRVKNSGIFDAKDCTKIITKLAPKWLEIFPKRHRYGPHQAFMEVSGCSLRVLLGQKPIKNLQPKMGAMFSPHFGLWFGHLWSRKSFPETSWNLIEQTVLAPTYDKHRPNMAPTNPTFSHLRHIHSLTMK